MRKIARRNSLLTTSIRWVLLRSQERSSCPTEKFTSGGSYPMLNSIDVRPLRPSVRDPNWDLDCAYAKVRLLTRV